MAGVSSCFAALVLAFLVVSPSLAVELQSAKSSTTQALKVQVQDDGPLVNEFPNFYNSMKLPEDYNRMARPGFDTDEPTVVDLGVKILHVYGVYEEEMTAALDVLLKMNYTDPRLKDVDYKGILQLEEIGYPPWIPGIDFRNAAEPPEVTLEAMRFNQDRAGNDLPDEEANGQVVYTKRVTVNVYVDFDYWAFPFDKHKLEISLASFAYNGNSVALRAYEMPGKFELQKNIDWIKKAERIYDKMGPSLYTETDSFVVSETDIERLPMAEIATIIFPLIVIVIFTFTALFIDKDSFGDQLAVASFGFLTAMAYVTVVYEGIPKTSYALWIHYYILVAFVFDVLVMVIVAVTHCMEHGFVSPAGVEDGGTGREKPVIDMENDDKETIRDKQARIQEILEDERDDKNRRETTIWWLVTVSRMAIPLLFIVAEAILFVIVGNYQSREFGQTAA